jgi:hypothetical protein
MTFQNKYAIDNIRIWLSKKYPNLELLSTEYGGENGEYISLKCENGHITKNALCKLKSNNNPSYNGCVERNKKRYVTKEVIVSEFLDRGYVVDTENTVFNGNKTSVVFTCQKHGKQEIGYVPFQNGSGCRDCINGVNSKNAKTYTKREVLDLLEGKGLDLEVECDDVVINGSVMKCKCNKDGNKWVTDWRTLRKAKYGCMQCFFDYNKGENNASWKGGVAPIHKILRSGIAEWKKTSMIASGFKCVLTGEPFDVVHHVHGFDSILREVVETTNVPIKGSVSDYTQEEIESLTKVCVDLHDKYDLGVCLTNEAHDLYHFVYGYGNNTKETWNEFVQDYKLGKYN